MELFLLYLWMKLNDILVLLGILTIFCIVGGIILSLCETDERNPKVPRRYAYDTIEEWTEACKQQVVLNNNRWTPKFLKRLKWIIPTLIALLLVIPTQTQTAVLVAGHYALRMADSPEASKVMQVLCKKANEYLDAELKEAKK